MTRVRVFIVSAKAAGVVLLLLVVWYVGREMGAMIDHDADLAQRRQAIDADLAHVAVARSPLPGKLLIVIPDQELVREQNVAKDPPGEQLELWEAQDRMEHLAYARAIVKARFVETAEIMEGKTSDRPGFEGYDYVAWYQLKWSGQPASVFVEGWRISKRGSSLEVIPDLGQDRPLPPLPTRADYVAGVGRSLSELAADPVAGQFDVKYPASWRVERDAEGMPIRGTSPTGDACDVSVRAGTKPARSQEDVDRELAGTTDDKLMKVFVAVQFGSQLVIDRLGKTLLHGRQVVSWVEHPKDDLNVVYRTIAGFTPLAVYRLTCSFVVVDGAAEKSGVLFNSTADTFYWDQKRE
jgi:hypothetical protein